MFPELSAVLNPDLFAVYYLESLKKHKVTVSAKKALNVSSFFKLFGKDWVFTDSQWNQMSLIWT